MKIKCTMWETNKELTISHDRLYKQYKLPFWFVCSNLAKFKIHNYTTLVQQHSFETKTIGFIENESTNSCTIIAINSIILGTCQSKFLTNVLPNINQPENTKFNIYNFQKLSTHPFPFLSSQCHLLFTACSF